MIGHSLGSITVPVYPTIPGSYKLAFYFSTEQVMINSTEKIAEDLQLLSAFILAYGMGTRLH